MHALRKTSSLAMKSDTHLTLISPREPFIPTDTEESTPEALFISALVDSGFYSPGKFGIRDEQFAGHLKEHAMCKDYQDKTGSAPPLELLRKTFKSFPYIAGINPGWAAVQLAEAHTNRVLRKALSKASRAVSEEAHGEAIEILKNGISSVSPAAAAGVSATDMSVMEENTQLEICPVLPGMLTNLTGGIASGDLWYVAARLGIGKSWRLIQHAVAAAEAGWDVAYYSLEMPAKAVVDRIHRVALRQWDRPWHDLELPERSRLVEEWSYNKGIINVYDPSCGRCDATAIGASSRPRTLVVVDYVGLMYTNAGMRSIEDWRAAATVSNQLKETALEMGVPIIAAAQINRAGEGDRTPSAVHLSQSDALGQDADALITLKKYSRRVLSNHLTKYRHGESGARWYTAFEPGRGRLTDIGTDTAAEMKAIDDEAEALS